MSTIVEGLIAGVLVLHGIAHLVGFVAPWRLVEMTQMPYKTTVLGGTIDLGDAGVRVVGVFWLIVAIAFTASAMGILVRAPWWQGVLLATIGVSIVLTIAEWPRTKIGLGVNVVLLAAALANARFGWLPA